MMTPTVPSSWIAIAVVGIAIALAPTTARAQQEAFTVSTPNGGDCEKFPINGEWNGNTCTLATLTVRPNQALNIVGRATVRVIAQVVNDGTIAIGEAGHIESRGAFVNRGALVIVSAPGFSSPGVSNHGAMQNSGTIFNANRNGNGGIFNNFGSIRNSGAMTNNGFFHNSGPPVQTKEALIEIVGSGVFQISGGGGILENMGRIEGRVL